MKASYSDPTYRNFTPSGVCARCGGPGTWNDPLVRGHVVPISKGGTAAMGLQSEHRSCNSRAGNA